jgi:hypothetical protein
MIREEKRGAPDKKKMRSAGDGVLVMAGPSETIPKVGR